MSEVRSFLERHLQSIFESDSSTYRETTDENLTLYEWYVTPHRLEGIPFHDFMMTEAGRDDTAGLALDPRPEGFSTQENNRVRFDLANYQEQVFGESAVCSYTMLISKGTASGVEVLSYNESRVLVKMDGSWKVVHVHKSPSWNAPFQPPTG
ncbi:MAG: hypothetical protein MUO58_07850 [Anaerolineales bacterium]|nr:hypothetical protein [Anaerolineales bacterium]